MVTLENQRVGVFVDVQNMFYSAKYQYNAKLNFAKLLEVTVRKRQLIRALAYIVQTPDIDQSGFITMLNSTGYEVRSKELKLRPDGSAKGDWDMGMAIDSIALAPKLDVVVLVSGDGDFCALVNMLKAQGVRTEVYAFPHSVAEELKESATAYYPMGPELLFDYSPDGNGRNGERTNGNRSRCHTHERNDCDREQAPSPQSLDESIPAGVGAGTIRSET